jgi:citrate synthase
MKVVGISSSESNVLILNSTTTSTRIALQEEMMSTEDRVEDEEDVKNDRWVEENFLDLVQAYPREWIAVMDQRVVCSGITESETESKAREIVGVREFSLYFIPSTPTEADVGYTH